jgi:hypothetical protein
VISSKNELLGMQVLLVTGNPVPVESLMIQLRKYGKLITNTRRKEIIMEKPTTDSMPRRSMPKYFKNIRMQQLFSELEIEVTKENTDKIDEVIHDMLSVDYPNGAAAWKMVRKKLDGDDPEGFKRRLKAALGRLDL